jgi:hypothetical protein
MYQVSSFYIHVVFRVVRTFFQEGSYHSLEEVFCFLLPPRGVEFYLEGRENVLQNVDNYLPG